MWEATIFYFVSRYDLLKILKSGHSWALFSWLKVLNCHGQPEYKEVVFSNENVSVTHLISLLLMNITQFYFSVPSMLLILYKNFHSCKFKICRWISITAHRITPISDLTASNQENNPGILVKIRCWHNWVHLIYKIFFFLAGPLPSKTCK